MSEERKEWEWKERESLGEKAVSSFFDLTNTMRSGFATNFVVSSFFFSQVLTLEVVD